MANQESRPVNGKKVAAENSSVDKVIADVTAKGKNLLNEGWETAQESFKTNAEAIREKAHEMGDKSIEELAEDARFYIRRNPLKSAGIAFGVGLVLGAFFGSD